MKQKLFLTSILVTVAAMLPTTAATEPDDIGIDEPVQRQGSPCCVFQTLLSTTPETRERLPTADSEQVTNGEDNLQQATPIEFVALPPTRSNREERGFEVFVDDSGTVRFEAYMGEQPTDGHQVQISEVVRHGDIVNVSVQFYHPPETGGTADTTVYPADAIEFELPNGNYRVNVHVEEIVQGAVQISTQN